MTIGPVPEDVQKHLAGQKLFHGTAAELPVGGKVVPGKKSGYSHYGKLGHSGQRSKDHAFATTNEDAAWEFGQNASWNTGQRSRVYEVAPTKKTQLGVYNSAHPDFQGGENLHEYVAPKFPVTKSIDTKPGHQGTFPQVNWNKHYTGSKWDGDANHPDPYEAHAGHFGGKFRDDNFRKELAGARPEKPEHHELPGQQAMFPGLLNDRKRPKTSVSDIQRLL